MSEPHDADRLKALDAKIAALKEPAEVKQLQKEKAEASCTMGAKFTPKTCTENTVWDEGSCSN